MTTKQHIYSIKKNSYIQATHFLTASQVNKLFKAVECAYKLGCPLNRFITIHFDDYADKKRPQQFVVNYLEHTRKWLKRRGLPVAYLYTLENGKNKGIHAHVLLHIPTGKQIEYKQAMANWLPFKVTRPNVVFKPIQYPHYGDLSPLHSVYGTLRYMSKGIDPTSRLKGIKPTYQGEIMGRRWGMSNLLNS